jgi:hypothetical protein
MKAVSLLMLGLAVIATPCLAEDSGKVETGAVVQSSAKSSGTETTDPSLNAAIALIKSKDYRKAVILLREIVKVSPDNAEANLYLGVALSRLSEKEAESAFKAALMKTPESPYLNFEMGLFYFNKNVDAEAGDYLENVIELNPSSPLAAQARDYLKQIEERGKEKRWELNALAGMQYDSNVIVIGDGPLPAGISRKSDFNSMVNLRGNYYLVKNEDLELSAGYTFYQTLHTYLTDFDVMQNVVDLTAVYTLNPQWKVKASYAPEYLLLGGNQYDYAHVFTPSLLFTSDRYGTMTFDYKFRSTSYTNYGAFTTNSDRNGFNNYFGVTYTAPIGKGGSAWMGLSHDQDTVHNGYWNYTGDRFAAGVRGQIPFEISYDLSGEYYRKVYAGIDPAFPDAIRVDDQYTATMTLMKPLSDRFTVMLMEQYTRDISNIDTYNTVRLITSLFLNARF